jgi:hypothetical protein
MAEFLVRVVDKVNSDIYLDSKCLKAGDVVVVCPDGWGWGAEELINPDWRIVAIPAISVTQAQAFLGTELDIDPTKPSRMLRRRAFKIDLSLLPVAWQTWITDNTRTAPIKTFSGAVAQVLALKAAKTPLVDPNVL